MANDVIYFGETDFRNERKRFGIKAEDRLRHVYIIGKTGVGKSTVLENMAVQDIMNGNGMGFFDPHGKTAELLLDYVPENRIDDVVYFAPFDTEYPISFNILETVDPDKRHFVANGILSVFKKIWADKFSDRMEYILGNTILALLEYPNATMLGINRMLTDKEYRKRVIDNISDPSVKAFWVDEYLTWDDRYAREAGAAIQNKVGQFTSNPLIRNIVGQPQNTLNIRKLMDQGKILIANLSKGQLGDENSRLLGGLLNTKIYLEAMSRAELSEEQMKVTPPFYLFVDEFQNFASESFADILSEARKYKLSLTMAHQYVQQMPDAVREAVFGNVGTLITFRVGPDDAEFLERQFTPVFTAEDLSNLGPYQIYLTLMINGLGSRPFSANTLPPITNPERSVKDAVIASSRKQFALSRPDVEKAITDWYLPIPSEKQIEHQKYLAQKKAEVESRGGSWKDPETKQKFGTGILEQPEPAAPKIEEADKMVSPEVVPAEAPVAKSLVDLHKMPKKPIPPVDVKESTATVTPPTPKYRPEPVKEKIKAKQPEDTATYMPDGEDVFDQLVQRATSSNTKNSQQPYEKKSGLKSNQQDRNKVASNIPPDDKKPKIVDTANEARSDRNSNKNKSKNMRRRSEEQPAEKESSLSKNTASLAKQVQQKSLQEKAAKPENKQALRDLIARVRNEDPVTPSPSKKEPVDSSAGSLLDKEASALPIASPDKLQNKDSFKTNQNGQELTSSKTPREVPEDILRSVLQ